MSLKKFGFMALIAAFALAGYGCGQEDDIVEVLLVDGPGGYLPDIEDGVGNSMDFAHAPSLNEEYHMDQLNLYGDLFNILNYWDNYLKPLFG